MTATTTAINGCNAAIYVDDISGSPTEYSGSANSFELSFSKTIGEYVTFQDTHMKRLECKKDGSLTFQIMYTTSPTEARAMLSEWWEAGGIRTISIYPNGNDAGEEEYTGEFILSEFSFSGAADDANPIAISVTCVPNGIIDITNVAT